MEILINPKKEKVEQKFIGLWITEAEYAHLVNIAKKSRSTKSSVARDLFRAALKEYKKVEKK